ncbi:MAG: YciI family protein [Nitrospiria bacterium]
MRFVMIGRDGPEGQEKRKRCREGHIQRLKTLDKEHKLILAGPFADKSGSLIVFEAESFEAAKAFAAEDPYVRESVFESYEVRPFKQVFPE